MTSSVNVACFYCSEYTKVAKDYPINSASNDGGSFTPRCHLHWKFECGKCGEMIHFNGISWCSECKTFTCLHCAEEKMVKKDFLVYDYYYNIPCHKCGNHNPALDFAEYNGTHPFQLGNIQPEEDIVMWIPDSRDEINSKEFPHQAWGSERILSLGKYVNFERLDSLDEYTPKSTWDEVAPLWVKHMRGGDEYHHTHLILPEVYRLLNAQKDEKILDVACGEGKVARHLAINGAIVTGIDISRMIDFAIEREEEDQLGISYLKINAEELSVKFGEASFDKVVCNMALMDIHDYKTVIAQISTVLKENGIFVFSITHPAFAWPTMTPLRIPVDSQRNEDRIKILMVYFDERPTLVRDVWDLPPLLQFHRSISSYLNELVENNLVLREISEPRASEELVRKFPRNAYLDDDIRPNFLIVKAIKKSDF